MEKSPVLRDADFRFASGKNSFALDDAAGLDVRARHVRNDFAKFSELPFVLWRKPAEQIRDASVSVRLVKRVPQINFFLQRGDEFTNVIYKRRNRRRIRPAADRINPRRIGKMMQHDHRRDAFRFQAVK